MKYLPRLLPALLLVSLAACDLSIGRTEVTVTGSPGAPAGNVEGCEALATFTTEPSTVNVQLGGTLAGTGAVIASGSLQVGSVGPGGGSFALAPGTYTLNASSPDGTCSTAAAVVTVPA